MLGDAVLGNVNMNLTVDQLLTESDALMSSLLNVQATYGRDGLIPWLDLEPVVDPAKWIGLGDNAALAQSLAVMVGSLQGATLTAAQQAVRTQIIAKINTFLDNQAPGYLSFVDPQLGIFRNSLDTQTN